MNAQNTVTFYLHPQLRQQAERGNHNFIKKVSEVLVQAGLDVAFDGDDDLARLRSIARPGRGMFFMDPPTNARGLTFRKTYLYPFWHIEKGAARWDWPVAQDTFDPQSIDHRKAANFYRFWQERLFKDAPKDARKDGFVYVPLQGKLLRKRLFQTCSSVDMVKHVLELDVQRQVVVTLHPTETYDRKENDALDALMAKHDRLFVKVGGMDLYLKTADYIVTQNSSVGFMGYFFGKPVILFGKSDFHHIALKVSQFGIEQAFQQVQDHAPNYAAYVYWFLQLRAINAGRPECTKKISNLLRNHGWPV